MAKTISLDTVEFAMLQELAKRHRLKPEQYIKKTIKNYYGELRR